MKTRYNVILLMLLFFIFSCGSDGNGHGGHQPSFPVENIIASQETDPVSHTGDAADDCAVWINPGNIKESRMIATDKKGGLAIYDLNGKLTGYVNDGKMNNVDLRYDFELAGHAVSIMAATNRSTNSIAVYKINETTLLPENVAARVIRMNLAEVNGTCMYKSPTSGLFYVFVTDKSGYIEQWRLLDAGAGMIDAALERKLSVPSDAEGCVVDDEDGALYIAEEHGGIWRFDAEPSAGAAGQKMIDINEANYLRADIEGLTIFKTAGHQKYLIASVQGNDSFAVFHIASDLTWRGSFRITDNLNDGIDKVTHTDGIDVLIGPANPDYPEGIFIAQDGSNTPSGLNQNFKFVSLAEIIARFNL